MATTFTNATCSIVLTALSASQAFACGGGGGFGYGGGFGGYGGGYSAPAIHQPIYRQPTPVIHQPQRVIQQPYGHQNFGQQPYGLQQGYGQHQQYGQQPMPQQYSGQTQQLGGQAPYGHQPQGQQPFAGQQPTQFSGQQQSSQSQQQPQPQQFAQQPSQQPAQQQQVAPQQQVVPQQQPMPQTAPQPSIDASRSALDALAAFGGAPAAQGMSSQSPNFIGVWTASVNGANRVQLQLDANGSFNWVANSNGKVSSFGGSYTLANGQLTLVRSSDNQQLAGTLTPESSGGFRFKLASASGDGLLFVQ